MDTIASQSLFTSQTPANTNNSDGTPGICPAVTIKFGVAGTIDAIRWYCTTNNGGTWTGYIWEVTSLDASSPAGTQLAAKASGTPTGGAWNNIVLDAPGTPTTGAVTIATNKLYRIGVYNDQGRYVSTSSDFGTNKVNGDLTAYADNTVNPSGITITGTLYQGTFQSSSTVNAYPALHFNNTNYFIDCVFTPSGTSGAGPNGLAVPVALGTPSAANTEAAAPNGLAVPVALGTPSVALGQSAAPTGIAVPAGLGNPSATLSTGPTGIAVPVALGTPSVALNRSAAPSGLAVPVALGNPSTSPVISPTGLSVPVSLGSPTVTTPAPSTDTRPGSWYGLLEVDRENLRNLKEDRMRPVACPNDGEPLQLNPRTKMYQCSYDGYVWLGW